MTTAPLHTHHNAPAGMMRLRVPGEHSRVTTFELFFDLVFVFAVTQLSHTLLENLDARGALHTSILLLAIWWAWMYTTWATNWCDPDHLVVRAVLIAIMLGGLVMSASIPDAFDGRGFGFAIPYVAIQIGRSAFVGWAGREDARFRLSFVRITTWFAVSAVLWLAGAAADSGTRTALWAAALGWEYLAPAARYWFPRIGRSEVSDWNVEGTHMAERCGLFIIIALGESLLVTGATFAETPWSAGTVTAMAAAFMASVAMWWIYFDLTAEAASERIGHDAEPGRLARLAYTYLHLPIVAGIIVGAVGDELALAHPHGTGHLSSALAIIGGPALMLFGYALFKRAVLGKFYLFHVPFFVMLAGLFVLYPVIPLLVLEVGAAVILALIAARGRFAVRSGAVQMEFEALDALPAEVAEG